MDKLHISTGIKVDHAVLCSSTNHIYDKNSMDQALEEFNRNCPTYGGILNRTHIQHIKPYTHIIHELYMTNELFAVIEFLNNEHTVSLINNIDKLMARPLIATPLSFTNSGVETVIKIITVQLELKF